MHRNENVVTRMITWLRKTYEVLFDDQTGAMTVHRGKIYEYLGMSLDFTTAGQVQFTMFNYIKKMVDDFTKINTTTKTAPNPSASHLFRFNEEAEILDEKGRKLFIHMLLRHFLPLSVLALPYTLLLLPSPREL